MKMYRKTYGVFVVLSACSLSLLGNTTSLTEVVNSACTFHPDVYTAGLQLEEANERVKEARATVFPRVNSITEIGIADDKDSLNSPLRNSRPMFTQLSLDQPVYLGGRARAAIKGAKFQRESERFRSESQILNAQLTAIQAYITLAEAQEVLSVRQQDLTALEQRRDDATRRFELGGGTRSDIVQAEARIARGQAEIVAATRNISEAQASLYEASGIMQSEKLSLPAVPGVKPSLVASLEKAGQVNPDIKASNALIDVSKQNIKTAQGDRSPELRLLGDLNVQRDTAFNGFERDEGSLRLRMTVPIFAGGGLAARERASIISSHRAEYDRNRVVNRVRENVTSAWSRLQASERLVLINEDLVGVAEKAAIAVRKEAEAGFRPNLDILDAQQELLDARLALTAAKYNNVLSAYFLAGAIGELDNSKYENCQALLPDFNRQPRYKIIEKIDTIIPGVKLKVPERRERKGPRSRR